MEDYLDVDQVEAALKAAASTYAGFITLIPLTEETWKLRTCHAVKIANGNATGRPGVFFLGGVHGDEWGTPDILINFIVKVAEAYVDPYQNDIVLGGKRFSHDDVRTIVDTLDIYVFPLANPDGYRHSRTSGDVEWRKNLRPADPIYGCKGVDVNRNFDFLWDFQSLMSPISPVSISTDPCRSQYRGPSPFSEPETRNVRQMFGDFPNIGYFVDLHSPGPMILYSWSDDDNQSDDEQMNFRNADSALNYKSVRGLPASLSPVPPGWDAYGEYIPPNDLLAVQDLAATMGAAILAVRNAEAYEVKQAVRVVPTAATSDDYAYSRHFKDPSNRRVLAFTIECGDEKQLPYDPNMLTVIPDVTSGLLAFCLWVRNSIQASTLTVDRGDFGKDEIDAMLGISPPARFDAAFYLVIDGFRHEELGITAATLSGIPDVQPTVTFGSALGGVTVQAIACSAEGNTLVEGPQRFTWTFALEFRDTSDFTQEIRPVSVAATLQTTTGVTMSAEAVLTLTTQPKPYEIDGPTSWLSVDLQVCQVQENGSLPNTPSVTLDAGPTDFIGRLLAAYNDPALPRAPVHPFDLDLVANQATASVEIAGSTGSPATPVYNFALARVRYRALATPASSVRVFFRTFQTASTSTEYQPSTTYSTGGIGGNKIPLLGIAAGEVITIPFFAAPRVDPTNPDGLDAQTDPLNVGPLGNSIPPDGSGAEVQVYFGCWLDINQDVPALPAAPAPTTGPFVPVRSIQQAIKGKHQCLVAEIQLDPPAPQLPTGATPGGSDRLAQRNLTIVGVASPHLVPVTFDIRPTAATLRPGGIPDELMIEWGNLPTGSRATIFVPGIEAKTIVELADRLYWHHELEKLDDHTLGCRAAGISYVPIPPGVDSWHAGLMTVEVPAAVQKGQTFSVVARQLTRAAGIARHTIAWRRTRGSFQVSIPVETKAALLEPERRLLSVLRFVSASLPSSDRWRPVFDRYLRQIAGRVAASGGDPDKVGPSTKGDWGAAARCRKWAGAVAMILAALVTTLGTLTGGAIAIVPASFGLLLVVVAAIWISRCRPGPSRLFDTLIGGVGLAATLLAILALAGWSAPQLVPVLCGSVILLATAYLMKKVMVG